MELARIIDIVLVVLCIGGVIYGSKRKWWILVAICVAVLLWELIAFIF